MGWETSGMTQPEPQFPEIDPKSLESIIEFAQAQANWLEEHAREASEHGHDPRSQDELIAGWRFVALALTEAPL